MWSRPAPAMTVGADRSATSNVRSQQYHAEAQRSSLSAPTSALSSKDRADADIGRKSKSP